MLFLVLLFVATLLFLTMCAYTGDPGPVDFY